MKEKGFTLIELLAVLIVLGIVMTMVIVSVNSVITSSEHSLSGIQKSKVEEAAKVYYLKEGDMTKTSACVNVSTLLRKGYIEGSNVTDPETGLTMTGSVRIAYSNNQYNYTYQESSCGTAVCTFTNNDSGNDYSLGDEVNCEGENFYIISSDTNTVTMIAKKNIEVSTNNPKQSDSAGTTAFSSSTYWFENGDYKSDYPASIQEASDIRNVYDSNSIIKPYLDAYGAYLSELGFEATIRLLELNDSVTVCGMDLLTNNTCNNPTLLIDGVQDYWSGAAYKNGSNTVVIYVDHANGLGYTNYDSTYGVRPVVVMNKSYIPLN